MEEKTSELITQETKPKESPTFSPFLGLPKISEKKLFSLTEQLRKENIPDPRNKDVIRILRVSAGQATLYLKAFREQRDNPK
jgi:hypothetical protein